MKFAFASSTEEVSFYVDTSMVNTLPKSKLINLLMGGNQPEGQESARKCNDFFEKLDLETQGKKTCTISSDKVGKWLDCEGFEIQLLERVECERHSDGLNNNYKGLPYCLTKIF